jgi:hypothetical protein
LEGTVNQAFTIWKGNIGGMAKLLGHPQRSAKDMTEVKALMKAFTAWRQ